MEVPDSFYLKSRSSWSYVRPVKLSPMCRFRYPAEKVAEYRRGMRDALSAGNEVIRAGGDALDAVVVAVVTLESSHEIRHYLVPELTLISVSPYHRQSSFQCRKGCSL